MRLSYLVHFGISCVFTGAAALPWQTIKADDSEFRTPIVTRGLVAYYPFNASTQDASGNGNHASGHGVSLIDDKFGHPRSAYYFDGKKDYIDAPVNVSPGIMPQVTMVVWARADQEERNATILSQAAGGRKNRALSTRTSPGKGGCWATSTNQFGSWVWEKLQVGRWTFLALTYDQAKKKLHLRVNQNNYQADCSQIDGLMGLIIGRNPARGAYFEGALDEVRIYNRILSDDEMADLYRQFQFGEKAVDPDDSTKHNDRSGLLIAFISAFCAFTAFVIFINLMLRGKA